MTSGTIVQPVDLCARIVIQHLYGPMVNVKAAEIPPKKRTTEIVSGNKSRLHFSEIQFTKEGRFSVLSSIVGTCRKSTQNRE